MPFYSRRTSQLHVGRISISGARYFVTFATEGRRPWLNDALCRAHMIEVLKSGHNARRWMLLAVTCMPDHVHVLFELGVDVGVYANVGRCVARWKNLSRANATRGDGWQRDFWEHRLRPDEMNEDYARYIYMNPYRAGLIECGDGGWDGTWMPEPRCFDFVEHLGPSGSPPVEWLGDLEKVADRDS
ncbi:putative transposase [Ereboglobus sp. PH5-5]|uniref:REP-associated tyrosine transposase n=1 Tax=unclassified Ereboglobus TaxID=2626932 RepID=UPI002404E0CE|nr:MULTISPECIES: transposase [unclassified Ereboglobus]MDF9826630.1 putative transposase [Ereboglobus sp. PH5-10]MDF9834071.1 putative transposase [Ereboglobus sp. PH5-5]